jgi:hypothetical protein
VKYTKSHNQLWKIKFNDRRVGERPNVSKEEIEWEKDQFCLRYPHRGPSLWDGRPNPRLNMQDDDDEDEDEDEAFGFGASAYLGVNLRKLKLADLPAREIDDEYIQSDLPEDNDPGGTPLTRVEVRYHPQAVVNLPNDEEVENLRYGALRLDDEDDDDKEYGLPVGLPTGKPVLRRNDPRDPDKDERFDKENCDGNDITAVLYNKRNDGVAKMSRRQAFKYCQARNIRFGFNYQK